MFGTLGFPGTTWCAVTGPTNSTRSENVREPLTYGKPKHFKCYQFARIQDSYSKPGLHNSEISKGHFKNINLPRNAKVVFILVWRFRCSMEEMLKHQLLEVELLQHFRQWSKLSRAARAAFHEAYVVQACSK